MIKGQINSEIELFNTENQSIATLGLIIDISNTAPIKQESKSNKPCVLMQLHINEILVEESRFKNFSFNFSLAGQSYKSKKYELRNENFFQINDCYFLMECKESQKLEILEIKVYEGERFFGYANIDLPKIISLVNKSLHSKILKPNQFFAFFSTFYLFLV